MRTQRATRYNSKKHHASYGISKWFLLKGIKNQEIMKECMFAFCQKNKCEWLSSKTSEEALIGFCQNRFQEFATFSGAYLKANNYVQSTQKQ